MGAGSLLAELDNLLFAHRNLAVVVRPTGGEKGLLGLQENVDSWVGGSGLPQLRRELQLPAIRLFRPQPGDAGAAAPDRSAGLVGRSLGLRDVELCQWLAGFDEAAFLHQQAAEDARLQQRHRLPLAFWNQLPAAQHGLLDRRHGRPATKWQQRKAEDQQRLARQPRHRRGADCRFQLRLQ
jgi:hypothetical protein